nr:MAK10-like protein [Tanacetum cinerariifolium]
DENPIRTLEDYFKSNHQGYRNTIELPVGKNMNDPRDFAKPVKAITLPQNVPSTFDRRLIKLENQVQCLMEAHIALMKPTHVNKVTTSCEICSGPHDTYYCMKDPVKPLYNTHPRIPMKREFEVDFKQQQSKMTNKIDIVLKAITDQMIGVLPSDTVKNPKLNVNSTSLVLSARSYTMEDPQCSSHPSNLINAIKTCSKETNHSQKDQLQMIMEIRTQQLEEPERT